MKKKIIVFITLILSLIMSASVFSGCDLATVDNERDMNQIVATVRISDDAPLEKIYKKNLVIMYLNYGYYYVYQGQYTQAQMFEQLLESAINNAVITQTALVYFNSKDLIKDESITDIFNADRYLTADEKTDAEYDTVKGFNDLIDSYVEKDDEEEEKDTSTETARTIPTNAANAEKELSTEEKKEYIEKGIITGIDADGTTSDAERKKAYNKLLKSLDSNSLLGKDFDFDKDSVYDSDYYSEYLSGQKETIVVTNYETNIKKELRATVTFDTLKQNYANMYSAQKDAYSGAPSAYATALNSATAASPLVYNPYSGYGYVYNLLIGADDVQKAQIAAIEENNIDEYNDAREKILSATTAKDLRSTWITSGYDFDFATKTFTGDYTFCKDAEKSLPFQGEVSWLNESEKDDDDYVAEYSVDSVREFGLNEFVDFVDQYLYGETKADDGDRDEYYKKVTVSGNVADEKEFAQKMNELLFAFSTDPGSLNTNKGYTLAPAVDLGGTEQYQIEFAEAGRELLTMGGNSYIIAATDYGYHFMYYSVALNADVDYPTLEEYLDSLDATKGGFGTWQAYYDDMISNWDDFDNKNDYLYLLQDAYTSTLVNDGLNDAKQTEINKYRNDEKHVMVYEDRIEDLLKG